MSSLNSSPSVETDPSAVSEYFQVSEEYEVFEPIPQGKVIMAFILPSFP